jgi:hypothetical protein
MGPADEAARLMVCKTCPDCGKGVPGARLDPVKAELCVVFCQARKEFCELKKQGKTKPRPSKIAEEKMKDPATQRRMTNALNNSGKFPRGASAIPEKPHAVIWNKPVPKSWKRVPMTGERLKRMMAPLREKIEREVKAKAAAVMKRKLAKKAATAWLKFVPVLNVISTAYDIYDIASTGYDLYKMIDDAMAKLDGKVFEIRPDVSIMGPDGSLQDTYDFKFDGDSLDNNPGQAELYREATGGKDPKIIDQETCKCK